VSASESQAPDQASCSNVARALCDERLHVGLGGALDVAEADAHGSVLDGAPHVRGVDVDAEHADTSVVGLVDEGVGGVEAHRLLVE
jgi:hypothetical protein